MPVNQGKFLPRGFGRLNAAFAEMAKTDADTYRYRRGYWLRVARKRAGQMTLETVAIRMDYSRRSASTIKRWEDGERDPSDVQLRRIAAVYGVPVEIFTEPDETDEERLDRRIADIEADRARRELRRA